MHLHRFQHNVCGATAKDDRTIIEQQSETGGYIRAGERRGGPSGNRLRKMHHGRHHHPDSGQHLPFAHVEQPAYPAHA